VVVRADSPLKTFRDVLEYAKANPGKLSYATPGTGTSLHLAMEEVAAKAGVEFLHVPFKGYADRRIASWRGHVMDAGRFHGLGEASMRGATLPGERSATSARAECADGQEPGRRQPSRTRRSACRPRECRRKS